VNPPHERQRLDDALAILSRASRRTWLLVALSIVLAFSIAAAAANSARIDGTRYHWLDDDQMISMRYARNLAGGQGLVWNPGERVEGYSNFLWTVLMAGVHLLPLADAHTSLAVRVLNAVLAGLVIVLTARLLGRLVPEPGLALPAVVLPVALSHELIFWSLHGFETTLLTVVFLAALDAALGDAERGTTRARTWVLVGLLPLVRADGYPLMIAASLAAIGLAPRRAAALSRLPLALALPVAHLVFRKLYYGAWLPNTYVLKVAGYSLAQRFERGLDYVAYFGAFYWLILLLTVVGTLVGADRRRRALLLAGFAVVVAYTVYVGGDNFFGARFLAPYAPLLFVLAAAGVKDVAAGNRIGEATLLAAACGSYLVFIGLLGLLGSGYTWIENPNGGPEPSLVSAITIRDNSDPDVRVAVHAAGIVPYFSRRHAVDMLGKCDPHVAALPPDGSFVGHDKTDPGYSLGAREPDMVVMLWLPPGVGGCRPEDRAAVAGTVPEWVSRFYLSDVFQREFCGTTVEPPGGAPIYVRRSSPERRRLASWRPPGAGS
jgi:hypothetical protein